MATGITVSSTSNLSSGQKIFIAAGIMANEPAAPDPDLVDNARIPAGTKQWDVLTHARLSDATALTEGVDLAQTEQLVANYTSITPTEHGIIATLSKRVIRRQGDVSIVQTAGALLGASLRRLMAKDVVTLYDGFSKSIVGAGNALDITYFRGANAYLMTDNNSAYGPAVPPFHMSAHIEQISDIIVDITDAGTQAGTRFGQGFPAELLQRWWKASDRLYGTGVFNSGVISRDGSDDAKGGLFAPSALQLVIANEADPTEETNNSARVIEYGIFQEWGEGEKADPHGVEVYSDALATV